MKIAIVSTTFDKNEGGATGIAYQQACGLQQAGHNVAVFTGTFNDAGDMYTEDGMSIKKIFLKQYSFLVRNYLCLKNLRIEREFKLFCQRGDFDVVHFHNFFPYFPFSLIAIAQKYSKKVFFTAHDNMSISSVKLNHFVSPDLTEANIDLVKYKKSLVQKIRDDGKAYNPLKWLVIRYFLRKATKIIVVSKELEKSLNQNKITNTVVLHNGIDVESWCNATDTALREKFGEARLVLFAGRLSGGKGGDSLVQALPRVVSSCPSTKVLILGEKNDYTRRLEEKIKKIGLVQNVVFVGYVPRTEMSRYYTAVDLVVVLSQYLDPFPTVNLEAMACGKPVVATLFGGSREVVKNNVTGYIVNPLDTITVAKAMTSLLSNEILAQRFGRNGQDRVRTEFNMKKNVTQLISIYQQS